MTDIRQGLFDLLKDIIDGEWGPYDDERYWKMVDEELPRLGLKEDRELLHAPTFESLGDGISVSASGLTAHVDCHLCEKSFPPKSPREAFDEAYEHAVSAHGLTLHYRTRWVSDWTYPDLTSSDIHGETPHESHRPGADQRRYQ